MTQGDDPLEPVKRVLEGFGPSERVALAAFLTELSSATGPLAGTRTLRTEYRTCHGRKCKTCDKGGRHGPYVYEVWRDGKSVRRRYIRKGMAETAMPQA